VAKAQTTPKPVITTRILFLLDGSGSMNGDWNNQVRFVAAKGILENLIDSLKTFPTVQLGLRVYGHQSQKDLNNCKDTKLETPFSVGNHQAIKDKLGNIQPKGVTPLAYSLEQAAGDFPTDPNSRNIIIIITDGLESCGGDPCKISLALQKKNIFLKPFVVGVGMDKDYSQEFSCVGTFHNANDPESFRLLLRKIINQAVGETQVRVDLLDASGKATETNVNVSFEDNITYQSRYDFVHNISTTTGKPDILKVDPVMSYNIRVNTIPAVYKKNVFLEGGKLNVIEISVPQGTLDLKQEGYLEYKGLTCLVRQKGNDEIVHTFQLGNEPFKMIAGEYELEILTLPRIVKNISIKANQTTSITLPSPGKLTILDQRVGYGSIYQVDEFGKEIWIYNLQIGINRPSLAMQPGNYKIVFRSQNARNADNTTSTKFIVKPNESVALRLF
jgi:Ca-activated chloride channel family protein